MSLSYESILKLLKISFTREKNIKILLNLTLPFIIVDLSQFLASEIPLGTTKQYSE